jgi:hypothetical protein
MTNEVTKETEIDNFRQFASAARAKQNFEGTILKYTKGNWTAGKDGTDMNEAQLIALIDQLAVGWTKWIDRHPVDYRVGFVAEGYRPPRRQDLDMQDESGWPADFSGKVRDPWQFGMHLPLVDQQGERFVFSTSSQGGRDTIANLSQEYADHRASGKNELPLVELSTDSYDHRSYGSVNVPLINILEWVKPPNGAGRDQKALPSAPMEGSPTAKNDTPSRERIARRSSSDMDDEIPF